MNNSPPQLEPLLQSLNRVKKLQPDFPLQTVMLNRMLHFTQRRVEHHTSTVLAKEGLLVSHWMVLAMLYGGDSFRRRPQELSMTIGQSGPNTTKTTTFLIEKGWVVRIPDPESKRSCWMQLTSKGRHQVEKLMPEVWGVYEDCFAVLNKKERADLNQLLIKVFVGVSEPC